MIVYKYNFCGLKIDKNFSIDSLQVQKLEYDNGGEIYKNCVKVTLSQDVSDIDIRNSTQKDEHITKSVKAFIDIFNLIFCTPSELFNLDIFINDEKFIFHLPAKEPPLNLYNFLGPNKGRISNIFQNFTILSEERHWLVFKDVLEKYLTKMSTISADVRRAFRWIQKGSDEFSSYTRLIFFWIAFNALYEAPPKNDIKLIKKYINDNSDIAFSTEYYNKHKHLLEELSTFEYYLGRNSDVPIMPEFKNALFAKRKDTKLILTKTIQVIYAIRNSLIHGSKNPDESKFERSIQISEYLLSNMLKYFLINIFTNQPYSLIQQYIRQKVNV